MLTLDEFPHFICSCNEKHSWIGILHQEFQGIYFSQRKKSWPTERLSVGAAHQSKWLSMIYFFQKEFIESLLI